ncbi:MAG: SDR family oxidoreductase [Rhizonema sp. NSF051]|nr:SDR family oxidoreductase [Rhizonema sp. NSF051]
MQLEAHCQQIVERARSEFGKLDILVNNATFQMMRESIEEIPSEEFDRTFKTNVYAMFYLCKAAVPHMASGSAIINTCSINAAEPKLLAYCGATRFCANYFRDWHTRSFSQNLFGNSIGRVQGQTQTQRAKHPVVKKQSKSTPNKHKAA